MNFETEKREAVARLDKAAARNRERLLTPDPHKLQWVPYKYGMEAKVGSGYLRVIHIRLGTYPGVHYTSSMGANSDNSFSGFLPGVTFEEALQIVYRDYQHYTRK
jgi:hypothetical protein